MTEPDRVIWRPELKAALGVTDQTIRNYRKNGKLPAPDVAASQKRMGWRLSTLHRNGFKLV